MKRQIFLSIASVMILALLFTACAENQEPQSYAAEQVDVAAELETESHDTLKYQAREFAAVKRIYKGPIYWTVTGSYEERSTAYPGFQTKTMVVQKVHWTRLARYGADGILGTTYKKTPIKGTVNWHPYYELPEFPVVPKKILKEDKEKD